MRGNYCTAGQNTELAFLAIKFSFQTTKACDADIFYGSGATGDKYCKYIIRIGYLATKQHGT
jgi:hypothetical protein